MVDAVSLRRLAALEELAKSRFRRGGGGHRRKRYEGEAHGKDEYDRYGADPKPPRLSAVMILFHTGHLLGTGPAPFELTAPSHYL
jgi:hypothetical protein